MAVSANTRTLNIDLVKPVGGTDWEGAVIRAKLLTKIAASGTEVMPPQYDEATTLSDGTTTMTLVTPPNDGTAYLYEFQIKENATADPLATFEAEVEYGVSDLEFSALVAAAGLVDSESPNSLSTLINAHEAAADPHAQYMTSAETDTSIATHTADDDAHHAPLTIDTNTASALQLVAGQVLSLLDKFLQNTGDTMDGNLTMNGVVVLPFGSDGAPPLASSFDTSTGLRFTSSTFYFLVAGSRIAVLSGTGLDLTGRKLSGYGENTATASSSSGALAFDADAANCYEVSLTENITSLSFTWPANADYSNIEVIYTQDVAGNRTIDHAGNGVTLGDNTQNIASAGGTKSRVIYSTPDGGTTVYYDLIETYS